MLMKHKPHEAIYANPRTAQKHLYAWARAQECLDAYRVKYEVSVRHWQALRAEGVSEAKCAEFTGILRATYFRRKRVLCALAVGILAPFQSPETAQQTKVGRG